MKVLLLSRYGSLGASSRVRYLQYLPYFRSQGISVSVSPLFSDDYLRALYQGRTCWYKVISGYVSRLMMLLRVRRYDVVIIEKELFPFLPAIAERLLHMFGVRYVVDYDDALFHRYDCHSSALVRLVLGRKIDVVMRHSAMVVAGNEYLAEHARQARAFRVETVPTVVDVEHYRPQKDMANDVPIVGWIGTPKTSHYLHSLIPVFEAIQKVMHVQFVAVGARKEDFIDTIIEVWAWSEATEVGSIRQFDIGIMPLDDSPWERGKCGYKLVQYMACGLPVVASPVGVNSTIVSPEEHGLLANTLAEWQEALVYLLQADISYRVSIGRAGRNYVKNWYSLQVQAPRLLKMVMEAGR
jgi:glycosyltransferase involved in cell wall biosynthesis